MKQKPFSAARFTPTKFDTAEDKAWFANHFVKFVESNFKQSLFTKRFYLRLSNTFGHIAHYNQGGFWDTFFQDSRGKLDFICQTGDYPCYGSPEHTYCDVEQAIQTWLKDNGILEKVRAEYFSAVEMDERETLAHLKAKYEKA